MADRTMAPRFTEDTKVARTLRDVFISRKLTGEEEPTEVRRLNYELEKYDVRAFGQKFRKYKDI